MAIEQHLTATLQLSLHDHRQELNGFDDMLSALGSIDEEVHEHEVRFLDVDPLQFPANVAASQLTPLIELDVAGLIADVISNADHFISIVANDPD